MNYKIPVKTSVSIAFAAAAIVIADYQLFYYSLTIGILYTLFMPFIFLHTLYRICRKCPHVKNGTCRHIIFGKLVSKIFKTLNPSPYTVGELSAIVISNSLFFLFPQYWLFKNITLFIIFWCLMVTALVTLRFKVCPGCDNANCFFYQKKCYENQI